jgi:hypothetical protein
VRRQIDAENERQKRTERLDALTDAGAVAAEILEFAWSGLPMRDDNPEFNRVVSDINLKVSTVKARFDLVRMADTGDAVIGPLEPRAGATTPGAAYAVGKDYNSLLEELTTAIEN